MANRTSRSRCWISPSALDFPAAILTGEVPLYKWRAPGPASKLRSAPRDGARVVKRATRLAAGLRSSLEKSARGFPRRLPPQSVDTRRVLLLKGSRLRDKEFFVDNLSVRIYFIIEMILVDRPCSMGVRFTVFQLALYLSSWH